MDYQKIYDCIIFRAKSENRIKGNDIYYEIHHILPRCLGGEGSPHQYSTHPNLVLLTAKEHFLSHWLLVRLHPENEKLIYAFWMMCTSVRYQVSSRVYEEAKKLQSQKRKILTGKICSEDTKNKISQKNKGKKRTEEQKKKMSDSQKKIPTEKKSFYGKKHSEESKKKMSERAKNRIVSEETKKKMSEVRTGKKRTEEQKKKFSIAMKGIKKRKTICEYCNNLISANNIVKHQNICKNNIGD